MVGFCNLRPDDDDDYDDDSNDDDDDNNFDQNDDNDDPGNGSLSALVGSCNPRRNRGRRPHVCRLGCLRLVSQVCMDVISSPASRNLIPSLPW